MSWREQMLPVRMERVALVAPATNLRAVLELVGDAGVVDLEPYDTESTRKAELDKRVAQAVVRDSVAGLVGWAPQPALDPLASQLTETAGAVVPLRTPAGAAPPTLLRPEGRGRPFDPLVETYATVPYRDVDLTMIAGITYVAMFGMMFGDVGHGLLLLLGAALVRSGRVRRLGGIRKSWPFLAGAGAAATVFGMLYGEFFGPTGVVPVLWLSPMEDTTSLLMAALGFGAFLLAGAYVVGIFNRVREGGWVHALYTRTGVAGGLLFLALGLLAGGIYLDLPILTGLGAATGVASLVLAFIGLLVIAGRGATAVLQAAVELFDMVIRLAANLASFARLAAFGLVHAALGAIVWDGVTALWGAGLGFVFAVLLFLVGNAVAFMLEALVAGVQALRLEYYELFSRVFVSEGHSFHAWRLPPIETGVTK